MYALELISQHLASTEFWKENAVGFGFAALLMIVLALVVARLGGSHRWYIRRARKVYDFINKNGLNEGQIISYLRKINPYVFEELVLLAFSRKGYSIERNKRYSGDGGIDGRVSRGGKKYYLQCKRYRNYINQSHVEEFSRVCHKAGRDGFFVHTGKTGKASRQSAYVSGNVSIVSGNRLAHMLMEQYKHVNI